VINLNLEALALLCAQLMDKSDDCPRELRGDICLAARALKNMCELRIAVGDIARAASTPAKVRAGLTDALRNAEYSL
jgi:hypothetical protein